MKKINQKLSDILDVEPISVSEVQTAENSVAIVEVKNEIEADTEFARNNIKELISKGNAAVHELASVAKDSQHPRSYEVLAGLIKNMSDLNKDLLELQKRKKDLIYKEEAKGSKDLNIDKAVFVGSTTELMKLLKNK